ncbi:sensor histidine kinase [Pseudonocardia zijingensis]|uniref:histidine kinase n=1 Tax=Pseudonocardia zijingensis TaxID=153376 RepID=A0ABP3YMZ8_9PSEU
MSDLVLAAGFLAMAAVAWRRHPRGRVGPLAAVVGVLVLLEPVPGPWQLLPLAWTAVLIHLVAALPSGKVGAPAVRVAVALGYVNAILSAALPLPGPVGKEAGTLGALLVGAVVTGMQWMRWQRTSVPGRRSLTPVLAATMVMLVVLFTANPLWTPEESLLDLGALEGGLVAVPVAYLAAELRRRIERGAVADLVVQLGSAPEPAGLQAALAKALHDPTLTLGHWSPESGQYLDAGGRPVASAGAGRVATRVDRGGEPVALLVHDPALLDEPRLIEAACTAAALALQNERLTADLRARLAQLAESRRHVVQAAEAERRRLERDLHDGVQQRLLAIPMTLSVAESALAPGAERARALIAEAKDQSLAVLDELRALSQGIHPTILTERGLEGAVLELTAVAPVPVRVAVELPDALSAEIETTAYYVVAEALANTTKHADATGAEVRVAQEGERLVVEIVDDGRGGADPDGSGLRGLAVRAVDNGGTLQVTSPPGRGTVVRAELPCG